MRHQYTPELVWKLHQHNWNYQTNWHRCWHLNLDCHALGPQPPTWYDIVTQTVLSLWGSWRHVLGTRLWISQEIASRARSRICCKNQWFRTPTFTNIESNRNMKTIRTSLRIIKYHQKSTRNMDKIHQKSSKCIKKRGIGWYWMVSDGIRWYQRVLPGCLLSNLRIRHWCCSVFRIASTS